MYTLDFYTLVKAVLLMNQGIKFTDMKFPIIIRL